MVEDTSNVVLWMSEPANTQEKKPKKSAEEKNKKAAGKKLE